MIKAGRSSQYRAQPNKTRMATMGCIGGFKHADKIVSRCASGDGCDLALALTL